ncbi:MAG: peptide deformylase [Bacteroidota bacterium]
MQNLRLFGLLALLTALWGCQPTSPAGFNREQAVIIQNGDAATPMRVFKITSQSDSLLLRTASEDVKVKPDDPLLPLFIDRLYATVRDSLSLGVGIAAPQVGILKNIIWVQRFDKEAEGFPFEVYLNPHIVEYSKEKREGREGCLSIPNRSEECLRSQWIVIEYDRMDGSHQREKVEDFTAVIFQHEIDHLNGILYLDHLIKHQSKLP